MKTRRKRTPTYRLHRPSGLGVVTLAGVDYYLGRHGTAASRAAFDRLLGEWLVAGRIAPDRTGGGVTVVEVVAAYLKHANQYYKKPDGVPTSEARNAAIAMRPLKRLYGRTLATNFGPLALQSVRESMIASGLSRGEVNKRINHVRRLFKWAVAKEIVPPSVLHGLQAVAGLRVGRSEARETKPVLPVAQSDIDAIESHVSAPVQAMIQVQLLTGCRAGEVVAMRPCDIDVSGPVWVYEPAVHKNSWRGRPRQVYVGPRAQRILKPFLAGRAVDGFLFSPRESIADRRSEAKTHRRPNQKPSPRATDRVVGEGFDVDAYRRAIARGCDLADVPRWSPGRLRHNSATLLRKEHGLEVASLVLGHGSAVLTDRIYAERDATKAIAVIKRIG